MLISMIAAMAKQRVIGANNQMPWHLPADLKHFKEVTMGKPIIMGRKTYESIGKALPGRLNIVISRSDLALEDAVTVNSLDEALDAAGKVKEVMIIGGGQLYKTCLPLCHRLYLTHINIEVEGDTCFPDYQSDFTWETISNERYFPDGKNPYEYRFETLNKCTRKKQNN